MLLTDQVLSEIPAKFLDRAAGSKRLPRTYLFSGASHSGKEFAAMEFFKTLNCRDVEEGYCGECRVCKSIGSLVSPDIYPMLSGVEERKIEIFTDFYLKNPNHSGVVSLLRGEIYRLLVFYRQMTQKKKETEELYSIYENPLTPTSVEKLKTLLGNAGDLTGNVPLEHIRKILKKVYVAPQSLRYKLLLIKDIGDLSKEGANILLKTIEEPPRDLIVIMVARRSYSVLPTIRSRAVQVRFRPYSEQQKEALSAKLWNMKIRDLFMEEEAFRNALKREPEFDSMGPQKLVMMIDRLKTGLNPFSVADKKKADFLNHLKSGVQFYHLTPDFIRKSLEILWGKRKEG